MNTTERLKTPNPLNVPYLSQLDNRLNPSGSCNVACLAMVMQYWGIPRNKRYQGFKQLEDELYQYCLDNGLNRHSPVDLKKALQDYGVHDNFTFSGSLTQCRNHINAGNPVIVHGYFTSFGHLVVLVGHDDKGFIVHDPYGEWFADGYQKNDSVDAERGKYQHYSNNLINRVCLPDGKLWAHFVENRKK